MNRSDPPRRYFLRQMSVSVGSACLVACGGTAGDAAAERTVATSPSSPGAGAATPGTGTSPVSPITPFPATGTAQFFLSSASGVSNAAFCLGQPFVRGEMPAGSEIKASIPGVQVTVKNRWPDGSARFAIVAGHADLVAGKTLSVSLQPGAGASGAVLTEADLVATGVDAKLSFGTEGMVSLASLIGVAAKRDAATGRWTGGRTQQWISGPQMSSWLYFAPLGSSGHLSAWFEVRLWAGGALQILPWIENGRILVAGPKSFAGELRFELNGAERFRQTIDLPHHCRTAAMSGAGLGYSVGQAATDLGFAHDTTYLQQTRLVPAYYSNTPTTSARLDGLAQSFSPLARVGYPQTMGETGYDPSIGLLPEWDVFYLSSRGDPRALRAVLVHALCAGRYPIHYRDERTNLPLRFADYPSLVLGAGSNVGSSGSSSKNQYTPATSGSGAPNWASSHHPSLGYFAYLLTGAHYFAEQIQFAATLNYLKQTDEAREDSKYIILTNAGANTTRGAAWALRTLVQAINVTPDADPYRADLLAAFANNLEYYHQNYIASASNPQGFCRPYQDYTTGDGKFVHAPWMEDFLTASFGYAIDQDLPLTETQRDKLAAFFAWKAKSVIGRLGAAGDVHAYLFVDAAQYNLSVAPSDTVDWWNGSGPWYADWGALYAAAAGKPNNDASLNALRGAYYPEGSSYWGNLAPAIAYAVEHGVAGAQEAFARLTSASNWFEIIDSWRETPVWSVRPRRTGAASTAKLAETAMPRWRTGQAIGEWREIASSSLQSIPAAPNVPGNPEARIDAWCGLALDERNSVVYAAAQGGHMDYAGNEVVSLTLNTDTPAWVLRRPSTPAASIKRDSPYYLDGRPAARHSYFSHQFIEQRNRAMQFYVGSRYGDGGGQTGVDGFDPLANDWDPAGTYPKPTNPSGYVVGSALCKDPVTGDVYWFPNGGNEVHRWSQSTNSWSLLARFSSFSGYYTASAFDTLRRRILLIGGAVGPEPALFTVDSAKLTTVKLTGEGATALAAAAPKDGAPLGAVYVPSLDAFVLRSGDAGARVFLVRASDFSVTALAASGGEAIPAALWGVYTRFIYAPQLGGIAYYPRHSSNLWFLRLL